VVTSGGEEEVRGTRCRSTPARHAPVKVGVSEVPVAPLAGESNTGAPVHPAKRQALSLHRNVATPALNAAVGGDRKGIVPFPGLCRSGQRDPGCIGRSRPGTTGGGCDGDGPVPPEAEKTVDEGRRVAQG